MKPAAARPHRIAIAAFAPAQALDVTGPLDVFAAANASAAAGSPLPYALELAAPKRGALATTNGVALLATRTLREVQADTLLIAGGPGARHAIHDRRVVGELRALCERVQRVGSICTGAFMLAAAGQLDGAPATTHWAYFDEFAAAFPEVPLERDALFVKSGRVHSSAGITAGIDYALSLVESDLGRAAALDAARELVVFMKRPGGQSQYSAQLAAESTADDPQRFAPLLRWMAGHLGRDLSVPALAERMAMSPRNFARAFRAAMATTPARHVRLLRMDAARRLLTDSRLGVARIAERCGFASEEAMRVAFQTELKVSPSQFRARFG